MDETTTTAPAPYYEATDADRSAYGYLHLEPEATDSTAFTVEVHTEDGSAMVTITREQAEALAAWLTQHTF